MAYHEAYWVVVGTAAPVIALGDVVALSQLGVRPPKGVRAPRRWWSVAYYTLAVSFMLQIVMLPYALGSLVAERDTASTAFVLLVVQGGLTLLLLGTLATVHVAREKERASAADRVARRPRRYPVTGRQPSRRTGRRRSRTDGRQ